VLHEILRQARAHGLVKDWLRLKDATPLIAKIALPSTLRLVAQTREQLVSAAEGLAAADVAAPRTQVAVVRAAPGDLSEEQRLRARVPHLRAIVRWGEQWQQRLREAATCAQPVVSEEPAKAFAAALDLAHKVLTDREPEATDNVRALVDQEVRTGKHGNYDDGYFLDGSNHHHSCRLCLVKISDCTNMPPDPQHGSKTTPLLGSSIATSRHDARWSEVLTTALPLG
jgi:hypothetical protein